MDTVNFNRTKNKYIIYTENTENMVNTAIGILQKCTCINMYSKYQQCINMMMIIKAERTI